MTARNTDARTPSSFDSRRQIAHQMTTTHHTNTTVTPPSALLRAALETQSIAHVIDTPDARLALVFLHTHYASVVTRAPLATAACVLPVFVDTAWPVRRLLRMCHAQAAAAHGADARRSYCLLRKRSAECYFIDRATANPLLAITPQPLATADEPRDGSSAPPNGDPLLDTPIAAFIAQRYITGTPLGVPAPGVATTTHAEAYLKAIGTAHAQPACACEMRRWNVVGMAGRLRCARQASPDCKCFPCGCTRLARMCASQPPTPCVARADCDCLLVATLARAATVLELDAVDWLYDAASEQFGEHVFDRDSPLVQRFTEQLVRLPDAGRRCPAVDFTGEARRPDAVLSLFVPDAALTRRFRFHRLSYDDMRARLGASTTISAALVADRRFDDVSTLLRAEEWFVEPALHYVRVAISGFDDYRQRLRTTATLVGSSLISADSERAIYDELCREPNRVLAVNRALAFGTPLLMHTDAYVSARHDNIVLYVMLLVHMIYAAERATEWPATPCSVGGTDDRLARLVAVASRERARLAEPSDCAVLRWDVATFQSG